MFSSARALSSTQFCVKRKIETPGDTQHVTNPAHAACTDIKKALCSTKKERWIPIPPILYSFLSSEGARTRVRPKKMIVRGARPRLLHDTTSIRGNKEPSLTHHRPKKLEISRYRGTTEGFIVVTNKWLKYEQKSRNCMTTINGIFAHVC